jgi:hypothetical protein
LLAFFLAFLGLGPLDLKNEMVVGVAVEVVDGRLRIFLAKKVDEGEPASEARDLSACVGRGEPRVGARWWRQRWCVVCVCVCMGGGGGGGGVG